MHKWLQEVYLLTLKPKSWIKQIYSKQTKCSKSKHDKVWIRKISETVHKS